jgi:uncharacterized membrane protein YhaH (DUF805 family)
MAFDIKQEIDKFDLKEWVSFDGRIARQTWWLRYFCVAIGISVVVNIIAAIDPTGILGIVLGLASIVLIWPYLAGGAKRLHDQDKSAWWMLIAFIPIVGGLALLVMLGFLKGTSGQNKYGPDPLGGSPVVGGQDRR